MFRLATLSSLTALSIAAGCSSAEFGEGEEEELGRVSQAAVQTAENVLVNQLGYAPGATKIAVVWGVTGSVGASDKIEVLTSSGAVATGGTFGSANISARPQDTMAAGSVFHANFSGFTTAGSGYKVRVTIGGVAYTSGPFNISNDPYTYGTKKLAMGAFKMINWKRSGYAVPANTEYNIAGHAASHMADGNLGAYAGTLPMATGPFDVAGGWYDAGDNGKYQESHAAATFFLANMYERMVGIADPAGTSIDEVSLGLTDSAMPDILDEIAWGTRWVMGTLPQGGTHKTTPIRTDLVMNKCTSDGWPPYPVSYEGDTTARSCMGPSTSATYSAVRDMAHVSRLMKPYGSTMTAIKPVGGWSGSTYYTASQYADELWKRAKEAFGRAHGKFPQDPPSTTVETYTGAGATGTARFTTDINLANLQESPGFNNGSGGYADEDMADDEYSAAVELYLTACARGDTTAVGAYRSIVTGHMYYKQAGWCDWGSESALADPDGEEVGCGTLSLITAHDALCVGANALPSADLTQMESNHLAFANNLVKIIEGKEAGFTNNYPVHAQTGIDLKWGSNGAQAGASALLVAAYQINGDKKYLRAAARAMDYLLGVNPMRVSYIIGFGPNAAEHTHDRAMGAALKFVHGTMVGGPLGINGAGWTGADNLLDDLAARFPGGSPINDGATPKSGAPLERYALLDNGSGSWESKENAINWQGSLAAAAWGMQVFSQNMGCSSSAECNDNNLCTTDSCTNGACNNVAVSCSDGRECTVDSCNPSTGACVNNDAACCSSDGECSDGTSCTEDVCGANELCSNPWRGVCCAGTAALTRVAAASSSDENTGTVAANAIDGNTSSRWASSFDDEQWLRIDLGSSKFVKRVVLNWEAAASKAYEIQVADATTGPWTTLYSTTDGNGGIDDLDAADGLVPAAGRYLRMLGHSRLTPYGHSLYEFEAYGDAGTCLNHTVTCGDNSCDGSETGTSCSGDCGTGSGSTPTCTDGIQNQTETGVDCGGPCPACTLANGSACTAGSQCASGNCVDGVCCNTTCGGGVSSDCQVCNKAGALGTCSPAASGVTCRSANGACDNAEACNGTATTCPSDGFKASGTVCRSANGACDVQETCSGSSAACPTDGFASSSTTCRTSAGQCDVAENCSGSSASCPSDGFAASGTTCTGGSCNGSGTCVSGGSLDPRASYDFNETSGTTAADSSGNGLNATLSGATFAAGYAGNGVRIAGGTQRVNLPANVVQSCTDATGFTIAARVKLNTNGSNWSRIFDIGSGTSNYIFLSPRAGGSSTLRFASKIGGASEQQISYSYSFPLNTWKHVAVTLGGNTGRLYLDGAQVAQNTSFSNDPSGMGATANNWLGDSQYSSDPTLDGTIDDLLIACRTYSASEISALVSGGCTMPAAPGAPSATGGTEQVSLSWPAVSGATSYTVRRSTTSGGPYTDVATGVSSTAYVNTVAAGTYYYVIAAVNGCGTSSNSSQVSGVSTNAAPSASITAPAGGATYTAPASVTINASAADTSFGSISRVEFYQGTTLLGSDTSSPYSYSWGSVAAGSYSLTAKAVDNLGAVTTSSAVSITVGSGCTLPAAPGAPSATGGTGQVSVSWPAVSGATSYSIRRSSTSGGSYTEVGTATTTSYVDTVVAGTYYYVIAAVNSCGTGANSSQVSGVSSGSGGGGPCDGLCANPTIFTSQNYSSGNLGPNATCHQYTGSLGGGNFGNFQAPRTLSVNGVDLGSAGGNISLPASRNGGYCFQATAGGYDWAYFGTW